MEKFSRGDIVLFPFPFIASGTVQQKLRPALIISDPLAQRRYSDIILMAITSKVPTSLEATEVLVDPSSPDFARTGLAKASVIKD